MVNLLLCHKAHILNSSIAAVTLANHDPSDTNLEFAQKLLSTKMTLANARLSQNMGAKEISRYKNKSGKYLSLFIKLTEIKNSVGLVDGKVFPSLPPMKLFSQNFSWRNLNSLYTDDFFINKDFTGCNFTNVYGENINFSGAKLVGIEFESKRLKYPIFIGSDLSSAKIRLNSANFSCAVLEQAELSLDLPSLSGKSTEYLRRYSEVYLDDLNADTEIFPMINSINDNYVNLKKKLMTEFIQFCSIFPLDVQNKPFFPSGLILNNILSKDYYLEVESIKNFSTTLVEQELSGEKNIDLVINDFSASSLSKCMEYFDKLIDKADGVEINNQPFNNSVFNKLMVICLYCEDKGIQKEAQSLYQRYLNFDSVRIFVNKEEYGDGHGQPDWSDKTSHNFLLLANNKVMLIDYENLVKMSALKDTSDEIQWHCFYLYDQKGKNFTVGEIDKHQTFVTDFKIFASSYLAAHQQILLKNILLSLDLSHYHDQFVAAVDGKLVKSLRGLVGSDDQIKLGQIFSQVLTNTNNDDVHGTLTVEYYEKLINICSIESEDNKVKSQALISLAAIFCYLSSSTVFGTEDDSPQALRDYVYALISKAHELAPDVMGNMFDNWKRALLGINDSFSCSSLLASSMIRYVREHFKETTISLIPPTFS